MKKNRDYTGKTIFIGIDVHKKSYSLAAVCDGELVKRDSITASPASAYHYIQKYFPNGKVKSAYEAGFSGFVLHRFLINQGIDNIVVNAASIEIGSRDRVKTDKRDATKIAVQLQAGRLEGIFVPPRDMEDRRELTRLRSTLVKERNRTAVRMKHKAYYYGLKGPDDNSRVCRKWIESIEKKPTAPYLTYVFKTYIEQWKGLDDKIKEIDELMRYQAKANEAEEEVYRSVPGIGPTAARMLANELGDMSHFSNERKLFSYTGLTPREHSSGEHVRRGHISKQGKPTLRSVLVQCSWTAVRCDPVLKKTFEDLSKNVGSKRAIVAIARRLIGRVRACFRKNEKYQNPIKENKEVA